MPCVGVGVHWTSPKRLKGLQEDCRCSDMYSVVPHRMLKHSGIQLVHIPHYFRSCSNSYWMPSGMARQHDTSHQKAEQHHCSTDVWHGVPCQPAAPHHTRNDFDLIQRQCRSTKLACSKNRDKFTSGTSRSNCSDFIRFASAYVNSGSGP